MGSSPHRSIADNGGNDTAMTWESQALQGDSKIGSSMQVSPEHLVKDLSETITGAFGSPGTKVKAAFPLSDSDSVGPGLFAAPQHAILGSSADHSSREKGSPPWSRWAGPCHWRCRPCTERLGYLLTCQALTVLHELARDAPRPTLGTLTISPPPGIKLRELRRAVEDVVNANGGHAIWGLIIQDGRALAYMVTTTPDDPKLLELQARASVHGDFRSAKFSPVRGSDGSWSPPGEAFAIHVGRVLRFLTQRCPPPPSLRPGYRFGASGRFASVLANALAILRRERSCQGVGRHPTRKHAGEISPDALGAMMRACRWCGLPVSGKAWRHPHCSTRLWRAKCALRSELSVEDFDLFQYRTDVMVHEDVSEPEAMERAFLELAGEDASLPRGFREVVTLPRESAPPGWRSPVALRMRHRRQ